MEVKDLDRFNIASILDVSPVVAWRILKNKRELTFNEGVLLSEKLGVPIPKIN